MMLQATSFPFQKIKACVFFTPRVLLKIDIPFPNDHVYGIFIPTSLPKKSTLHGRHCIYKPPRGNLSVGFFRLLVAKELRLAIDEGSEHVPVVGIYLPILLMVQTSG